MSWRSFVIAALAIIAAFALAWYGKPDAGLFLTLIGGSPLAAQSVGYGRGVAGTPVEEQKGNGDATASDKP